MGEKERAYQRAWYAKNAEKDRAARRERHAQRKPEINARRRKRWATFRMEEAAELRWLIVLARKRANKRGLAFTISAADLVLPSVCPVFGTPLDWKHDALLKNRPSIDRTTSSEGYVKGNVEVISHRANTLKNDMTAKECRLLLTYLVQKEKEKEGG